MLTIEGIIAMYRIILLTLLLSILFPALSIINYSVNSAVVAQTNDDSSGPELHIGGALRYNFYYRDYGGGFNENDVIFTIDMWRLNATVTWPGNIGLNFEYRFYPSFNTHFIKQGWLEYTHRDKHNFQLGVTQVPFGNVQYNSHNWWFQLPYYLGLEDDHDMGLKYTYSSSKYTLRAAWFLMPESAGPAYGTAAFGVGGSGRYSYDIIPITGNNPWDYVLNEGQTPQSNQERNQFNLQGIYHWTHNDNAQSNVGVSLQYHSIYNQARESTRWSPAVALHLDGDYGNFNIKAQYLYYNYDAEDDAGNNLDSVFMAAYGDPYGVSAEGQILTFGAAYSHDVSLGPISNIQFYDNISYMVKSPSGHNETVQHVIGMLVSAGNVYTYFDVASGLNHPWLTSSFGEGLAAGVSDPRFNTRFNINIGYYF